MRTVVCDAGPIIHLYEAHCLVLLRHTGNLYLPQRVFNEAQATLQMKDPWPEWLQVISLSPMSNKKPGCGKKSEIFMQARRKPSCLPAEKRQTGF